MFLENVVKRSKENIKTIVLPESEDIRVLKATDMILKQTIADVILIGNESDIRKKAQGFDIDRARIIDPLYYDKFEDCAKTFCQIRSSKGITLEEARKTMIDPLYFGAMLVKMGQADGMVAGAINSTSNTLRPALQILKTAPGTKLVSSFFVMDVPDCQYGYKGTFVYADCGLVENPTAEELAEIAVASAKSFEVLVQQEPIIAMLSYSSYGSAKSELVDKVKRATQITNKMTPNLKVDGELQADAAIEPSIALSKAPGSNVAGKANVLIFPDLNSGNIAYKLTQRLAKADAYGPITQGLSKPVNDLSRGCTADDILGVVAVTCVQAQSILNYR